MVLDARSLAAFRIGLALVALDQSVMLWRMPAVFHTTTDNTPAQGIVLAFLVVATASLALGLMTRLSTLFAFVGLVLIQDGSPQVLQGGDVLLRLLLFWSFFLPLGDSWSLDAWIFKTDRRSSFVRTAKIAAWALTLQICLVYWSAALLKTDSLWRGSGNALFYVLSIDHFTTPLGQYLRHYPGLLRLGSLAVPWAEFLGPFLLFIPVHRDIWRMTAVTSFIAFHLIGMQLLLRIGLFPWVCAVAWLLFIPSFFWHWTEHIFKGEANGRAKSSDRSTQPKHVSASAPVFDYAASLLVVVSFLDVLAWNIASLRGMPALQWMRDHDFYAHVLRLDQRWNMYAPGPRRNHGWLVVPADLSDGSQIDLFTGRAISWEKPPDIGAFFGDDRSRRFLSNLFDDRIPGQLQNYAHILVEKWNDGHGSNQKVIAVSIVFMKEVTQPDLTISLPKREVLYFRAY